MNKEKGIDKVTSGLFYGMVLLFFVLFAVYSNRVIPSLQESLVLCYKTVIPSLFPFFVLSGMLISGGVLNRCADLLSGIMYPLFRVRGASALSFVIGLISGYPMGAKITAELYKKGEITRTEAERLLPFCNNAGPLFVIGAVGTGLLHSTETGLFLYAVHAFCAFIVGRCFRFYHKKMVFGEPKRTKGLVHSAGLAENFSDAVTNGVHTLFSVCGFILFFAAVVAGITPVLEWLLPPFLALLIKSVLEVTGGTVLLLSAGLSMRITLALVAFFLGFGGLCVMMQAKSMLSGTDLGLKTYCLGKLLHGALSAFMVYGLYPLLQQKQAPVFLTFYQVAQKLPTVDAVCVFSSLFLVFCCIFLCVKFKKCK